MGESQVAPSVRLKYFYAVVSFLDGGLYFCTYETDSDEEGMKDFILFCRSSSICITCSINMETADIIYYIQGQSDKMGENCSLV